MGEGGLITSLFEMNDQIYNLGIRLPYKGEEEMPLIKSGSKAAIGKNILEMEAAGHPKDVAVAAALNTARKSGAKIPKKGKKKK